MVSLNELVDRNYDALRPGDVEECSRQVSAYLRHHPSILHESPTFVKEFTKVAEHLIKRFPVLFDGLLPRLFQYHLEGVQLLRGVPADLLGSDAAPHRYNGDHRVALESHLYSHASDIARMLFDRTKDVHWGIQAFQTRVLSAEMNKVRDPGYALACHLFAGSIAHELFDVTGDVAWAREWYANKAVAAEHLKGKNGLVAVRNLAHAARAADVLFKKTGDALWAEKAYDHYLALVDVHDEQKWKSHNLKHAGEAARACYIGTRNVAWLEKAYVAYSAAAKDMRRHDAVFAARQFRFAGNAAREYFNATHYRAWGMHAIECYTSFFELVSGTNYVSSRESREVAQRRNELRRQLGIRRFRK